MQRFLVELNVTQACNFRCSYCFEGDTCLGSNTIVDNLDDVIVRLDALQQDPRFQERFDGLAFDFWGGEPTLYPEVLEKVMSHFGTDTPYHMYTNGYTIDTMLDKLIPYKDCLDIQVSYDGNPVHDQKRQHADGSATSEKVKENIKLLIDSGIRTRLKSTILPPDFKHIPDCWDDIHSLTSLSDNIVYAPTIDYSNAYDNFNEDLMFSLIEIARRERIHHNRNKRFLLSWFGENSVKRCTLPSAGMFVDTDGGLFYCHGCSYTESTDLKFGTIYDGDLVDKILHNNEAFVEKKNDDKCDSCMATVCLTCNVSKYINSKKEDFYDRWNDYSCDEQLCEYYQTISKVSIALKRTLGD